MLWVVSGVPRSGTSIEMLINLKTFGEDRILGSQFPKLEPIKQNSDEPDSHFAVRKYLFEKENVVENEKIAHMKMMNPNGFWEHAFTTHGVRYFPQFKDDLKRIEDAEKPLICKIVAQGLAQSDPRYIDKVIYMLRDPASVAKSQENIVRNFMVKHPETGKAVNLWEGVKPIDPIMFIQASLDAATWFKDNPQIPVHFVKYDDLVMYPEMVMAGVKRFLGEGDFTEGIKCINKKLNRSKGHVLDHPLAKEAELVYLNMCNQNWKGIEEYLASKNNEFLKSLIGWKCLRSGITVHSTLCKQCHTDSKMRESFKNVAADKDNEWKEEPCIFECAMDVEREKYVTIENSIQNNHWLGGSDDEKID